MPNWCENHLELRVRDYKGKRAQRKLLRSLARAFNRGELLERLRPIGAWYDIEGDITSTLRSASPPLSEWRAWEYHRAMEMWGTRSCGEGGGYEIDFNRGWVRFDFATAWSPALAAVKHVDARLDVELAYVEYGMSYMGSYTRVGGVEEEFSSYLPDVGDGEWDESYTLAMQEKAREMGAPDHLVDILS